MRIACGCANAGGTRTCRNCLTAPVPPSFRNTRSMLGRDPSPMYNPNLTPCLEVAHVVTPVVHKHRYPPGFQLADQLLEVLVGHITMKCQVRDHVPDGHFRWLSSGLGRSIPLLPPELDPLHHFINCSRHSFSFFFSSRCNALLGTIFWVWHIAMYKSSHK